ncbi:hypothetical protein JOM56_006198 [Amanita muscaria]
MPPRFFAIRIVLPCLYIVGRMLTLIRSGTTGGPKGVLTTLRGIEGCPYSQYKRLANALRGSNLSAIANAYECQLNYTSTYLWILPMFHAAGWTFPWANVFAFATQITLRTVNYTQIWHHLIHSHVTHYCGAPTVQIGLVNDPLAQKVPQSVTAVIAGSAPTPHLIAELEKKGIKPVHVYGST